MAKITDLTASHSGKWYEVGVFVKENDDKEELDIIAKFKGRFEARLFADVYNKNVRGVVEIIIR